MAATPGNALNIATAGYVVFDGTASFSGRTFQAGAGISLTNASGVSGNTTIATTSSLIGAWTDESTSFSPTVGNGYFITGNASATMPASPTQGQAVAFNIDSASAILTLTANTGQVFSIGKVTSASAGTCVSNFNGDSVLFVFRNSDSSWRAIQCIGTFTVT
jgi:hypothetical protein